jgi:hypothetical protein
MTIHRWIAEPREAGDTDHSVLILKKIQGSAWSEAGRTRLCPTLEWLLSRYGEGQYELRLKQGARVLCISQASISQASLKRASTKHASIKASLEQGGLNQTERNAEIRRGFPAPDSSRGPRGTGLRGTALG